MEATFFLKHASIHLSLTLLVLSLSSEVLAKDCTCGIENVSARIINGRIGRPGHFPWIVYILNRGLLMSCTGTIVSERHIVTAAHCLSVNQNPADLFVFTRQGCEKARLFRGNQLRIRKAFRHADYSTKTAGNDIAILVLDRPLLFNATFMPICLMMKQNDEVAKFDNFVVSGWGSSNQGFSVIDNDCLNEAELDVVSDRVCKMNYGASLNTSRIICAGGQANICSGDSGAPLMTRRNGAVFLAGITSFGRTDCGIVTKQPAGFERLSAHYDWLYERSSDPLFGRLCFK